MDDRRTAKKILGWKPRGTRVRGRPRKRWILDINKRHASNRNESVEKQYKGRIEWKRITEKVKTHMGCNASKRRRRRRSML